MKKILTILAATATLFAFGDDFTVSGTSFESYGTNVFNTAKDDSGDQAANTYWFTADNDAANVLSNYVGDVVNADQKKTPTGVSRPDYFAPSDNTKYLSVETTGKLYRSLVPNEQNTSFTPVAIPDSGIYLDTLVKFTAADSVFGYDALEDGDKIAIEYVEHEPEESGDDAITNFVVRAGFIGSSQVLPTNYVVALPANFERDAWHRLTVRTLKNVDGHNRVGFKIYIDENVLNYITNNDKFAMSAGFEDDTHTIFPSAVDSGDDKTMISAVAFSGNGSIDDVVFTATKPNFIATSESVNVTFTKDSGVTAISVQVAEVTNVVVDMTALTATLPAGTTAFTVTATIDGSNGYTFDKMTVGEDVYNTNPANITNYVGAAIAIKTTRNNFNVFDASGNPISGTFQTLGAALAAQGVAKIQLAHDYDVVAADIEGYGYIDLQQSITLDLNGKILDGGESASNPLFMVSDGNFVIIDSVGGGKVVYDGPGIVYGSSSYIGAVSGDLGPTFDGKLFFEGGEGSVIRGKFEKTTNGADAFTLTEFIAEGSALVESIGDYWVVAPSGGSEPTQVAVPTAVQNLVYDGTEQTGVVAQVGYTLTGTYAATDAGDYTATATLEQGYVWSDSSTEAKSINWSIAADSNATVVVTLSSEIAEYSAQLEFPAATATINEAAVAGTPVWDPATISEPEAGATNTYTVTFTVTTANYAGSTGTATFKVFKTAGGGSNWPSSWNGGTEPASMAEAFNTWVANNDPTAANAEAAFLVGVNVAAYTSDFAAASITIANGKVVITGNYDLTKINGALAVKMGDAPNALNTTTAVAKEALVEGAISLTPALGETKKFYQLVIGYPAN